MKNWDLVSVGPIMGSPASPRKDSLLEQSGIVCEYEVYNADGGGVDLGKLVNISYHAKFSDYKAVMTSQQVEQTELVCFYIPIPNSEFKDIEQLIMAMNQQFRPTKTDLVAGEYKSLYKRDIVGVSLRSENYSASWISLKLGPLEMLKSKSYIPQFGLVGPIAGHQALGYLPDKRGVLVTCKGCTIDEGKGKVEAVGNTTIIYDFKKKISDVKHIKLFEAKKEGIVYFYEIFDKHFYGPISDSDFKREVIKHSKIREGTGTWELKII
ncbi:hypothetical protein SapgrDRAFT_3330 [Saprospira grandis DSM 2844]|uniref:Uncharacterized protein n=1 Tax=Saprospira grandis DSM 2844 TaxID=694433 RepID=J1I932_9BACT|nr:hypothetical protein [Saprospira grandis]EJF54973.1 hypothetical protein SapgrDRAFT_3330 [Saprospira grandis DSM 2844]